MNDSRNEHDDTIAEFTFKHSGQRDIRVTPKDEIFVARELDEREAVHFKRDRTAREYDARARKRKHPKRVRTSMEEALGKAGLLP